MTTPLRTTWTPAGGRACVRRLVVCLAIGAAGGWSVAAPAADTGQHVDVKEERGVYHVTATFTVPYAPGVAMAVLTDYEQVPRFLPGVTKSVVRDRADGRVVVEQEMSSRYLMVSRRIQLTLEVVEGPGRITFRDISRQSFHVYDGGWTLTAGTDHTVIGYTLTARPNFSVPGFVISRLFKRDSARMIQGLRAEMAARAARETLE